MEPRSEQTAFVVTNFQPSQVSWVVFIIPSLFYFPFLASSKPFVLTVVTDGDDMSDVANRGFSLNYQQLPCGGAAAGMMLLP
jgi:hypothetical protein